MTALPRSHVRRLARYLAVLGVLLLWVPNGTAQKPTRGAAAPDIDLPTLTGGRVKLSSLKGHPVVVTFWGTWCPPCRDEFPELVAAQKKYRDSGLVVLAVNQRDQELSTKVVDDFVKEFGADFAVALDTRGHARRSFRLVGLPTMVFVDAAGVIQGVHPGPITPAEFDTGLAAILGSRADTSWELSRLSPRYNPPRKLAMGESRRLGCASTAFGAVSRPQQDEPLRSARLSRTATR